MKEIQEIKGQYGILKRLENIGGPFVIFGF